MPTSKRNSLFAILIALAVAGSDTSGQGFRLNAGAKPDPIVGKKAEISKSNKGEKEPKKEDEEKSKKKKTIAEITKDSTRFEGLFTLYQNSTNGSVHLLIKREHIGKEFIYFTYTADGVVDAGHFRGAFRDNRIFSVRKHFNRIEFVAENTAFYFDSKNALSRAASANISPSILASQEIVAEDLEKGEYLVKADGIYLSESFHQVKPSPDPEAKPGRRFTLGSLSKDKSKYLSLRNYPKNTDVIVEYVYENPTPVAGGGEEVTDARNVSIRMQHTLIEMPQNSYSPRYDDPRIGYFTERVTDLTSTSPTPYKDLIHRWHLEKKDKNAPLSEPVEPLTWWIENTTPVELRDTIRDAVLTWNQAFEAAGFKNAVAVKIQPDDATWDAGDIRYNVLRWTSSPNPPFGGYGPSFVNPRTGEILGADIMLEYVFLANNIRRGRLFSTAALNVETESESHDPRFCSLGHRLQLSTLFGVHALKANGAPEIERTELVKESLYYLILHEVGHTLGLNHNMRSSQLHTADAIHNKEVTEKIGLTGSVMDYPSVNLAPPGKKQGQYYTTRPGPYDLWAIEFGYSPDLSDASDALAKMTKLLDRSTESALAFGNDADDMRSAGKGIDPRVMIYDLSSDAVKYAEERLALAKQTLGNIKEKVPNKGSSYQELLFSYYLLTSEMANSATVVSRYIGGVYVDRSMFGQDNAGKPFTPVSYDDQKRAMTALSKYVFAPNAFDAPNELYNFLQMQRRGFDFFAETEDPKVHSRILNIQKGVLDHVLHPRVMARLTDSKLYGNKYSVAEMMDDLTQAFFAEDAKGNINTFRQNLQAEYILRLSSMVSDAGRSRYDHVSQSSALFQIKAIQKLLTGKPELTKETQAHTARILFEIEKALNPKG